ncbi:MAG: hypothetical protein OEM97_10125 [Acidimicrobiia bacterium]|nr:hypothetical protein [Acidimicrobiia bacterium]
MDDAALMLFQKRFWEPIQAGDVTMTFRRWKRPQVIAGRVYRTAAGRLAVTTVDAVTPSAITDSDARRAGHPSAAALVSDLPGRPGDPIYRVVFRYLEEPDPRDVLAADDALDDTAISEIDRRLDRLDRASTHGAWTRQYLDAISTNPGVRAPDLAERFGRDVLPFKADVRKLKNLGLTLSLRIGYELSPRGAAYLTNRRDPGG